MPIAHPQTDWVIPAAIALLPAFVVACGGAASAQDNGRSHSEGGADAGSSVSGSTEAGNSEGGTSEAGSGTIDGGPCPVTSPTYCTGCNGTAFCVSGTCPVTSCPAPSPAFYPFPPPPADAGAALTAIYTQCGSGAPRPLTAGALTEPRSGTTLHWPAGWMTIDPSRGQSGVTAPYSYVPTAATAATSASATMAVSPSGVSSDAQGQQVLQGWVEWGQAHGGSASSIMLGGHPVVIWWDHEAPARAGCSSCPLDPGPDLVTIGLAAYLGNTPGFGGLTVVEVLGSARIDAVPLDIFCDMEAMALGVTFSP